MTLLFAQRINRVIFLIFQNTYFNIENTLTNTNTASLNPTDAQTKSDMKSMKTLKLIGAIKCLTILMQLFNEVKFLHENKLKLKSNNNNNINGDEEVTQSKRNTSNINYCCLLCLDEINDPTSAMCGHIFCYTCIQAYIKSNSQRDEMTKCPSCRNQIDQNKLIYLHNF
jgi:hypothetical protein